MRDLNHFAWCFYRGGEDERAWEVFRRLAGQVYAPVWGNGEFEDDPLEGFAEARDYLIAEVALGDSF